MVHHNNSILHNNLSDSGFDLFVPEKVLFEDEYKSKFIDMEIKAELTHADSISGRIRTIPFNLYPRSSISKTPLMLANHTGVIDSGYRGNLIGAFRSFESGYTVEPYTRLLQICSPTLSPIYVVIVDEDELSSAKRGTGGFGSTGI
jgi:dUTP pyrophosphatase